MAIKKVKLPDNSVVEIHDSRIPGVDSVPTSGSTNIVTSGGVYSQLAGKVGSETVDNIVELTKAQYDALATKDPGTLYIVSDAGEADGFVSIVKFEQTTTSTQSNGTNVWTVYLSNGQSFTLNVRNGTQGAQGNSGYSGAAGELQVVNNLTDGGATAALSAEMGKELSSKLHYGDVSIGEFALGYYSTNGTTIPSSRSSSTTQASAIIPVDAGVTYKIYGVGSNNNYYRLYAFYDENGNRLERYASSGDFRTTPLSATAPTNATQMVVNFSGYDATTDKVLAPGDWIDLLDIIDDTTAAQNDIDGFEQQYSNRMDRTMVSDEFTPLIVDWMQAVHAVNGMTSVSQMSVVSSTSSALTLSSADAATFTDPTPAVVGMSDGSYRIVFFQAASGTTVTRAAFETIDLTNASTVQSLHDTVKGGGGIHLSQMGYLALAQSTAAELAKVQCRKDDLIAGANFFNCTLTDDKLYDEPGNLIASFSKTMKTGTSVDGSLSNCGINASALGDLYAYSNGWLNKCFRFLQGGTSGLYAEFTFPAIGKGYIEIQGAMLNSTGNRTGTATISVYADGTQVGSSQTMVFNQTRYYFGNVSVNGQIRVRVTVDSTSPTYGCIYGINFWRCPSTIAAPSLSGKKIAVLGDSWTQFPAVNNGLSDHESYNVRVTRPDNTSGDGYGYFPKELARVTGATVDNWGKSNMRADNWGLPMIDTVLAYTDYDYLLIEYFINDGNAGVTTADWLHNIRKIAQKAISKGVRPIIICPCRTNSATVLRGYWSHIFRGWRED